jgi:hypothetical protein
MTNTINTPNLASLISYVAESTSVILRHEDEGAQGAATFYANRLRQVIVERVHEALGSDQHGQDFADLVGDLCLISKWLVELAPNTSKLNRLTGATTANIIAQRLLAEQA